MSQFVGKVALITGGNAGIGRATAIEFAKQGAKVVVSGRREKEGHEVIAEIKKLGGEAIFVKTDVSKASDVKAMIEQTLATFGRSILPSTTRALRRRHFTPDQTEETTIGLDINVKGAAAAKYEIPAMLKPVAAPLSITFHCGRSFLRGSCLAASNTLSRLTKAVAVEELNRMFE